MRNDTLFRLAVLLAVSSVAANSQEIDSRSDVGAENTRASHTFPLARGKVSGSRLSTKTTLRAPSRYVSEGRPDRRSSAELIKQAVDLAEEVDGIACTSEDEARRVVIIGRDKKRELMQNSPPYLLIQANTEDLVRIYTAMALAQYQSHQKDVLSIRQVLIERIAKQKQARTALQTKSEILLRPKSIPDLRKIADDLRAVADQLRAAQIQTR